MAFALLCISIFIMFFQPVFVFPGLTPYQPLRNSALLALAVYLVAGRRPGPRFLASRVNRYFVLFVACQVASASAIWLTGGWELLNVWLRLGIMYFLIVKSVTDEKRARWVITMIVLAVCYLSYFSISRFVLAYMPGMRAEGFGLYENANDIAIILVTIIPLALLLANTAPLFLTKYLFLGIAVAFSFNILFTGSRNGLLGLLAVGVMGVLFSRRVGGLVKYTLAAVLIVAVFTVGKSAVLSRGDLTGGLTGDPSSENRIDQWWASLRMLKDHPVLGVGPNEFMSYAGDYGGISGLQAHNTILQVFAETGLLGGMFFSLFSLYPLYDAWRWFKKKNEGKSTARTQYKFLTAALIGFWICAVFGNRYQFYILYVLVALMVAMRQNILTARPAAAKGTA
jgi:O-antigen ligase